MAKFGIALEWGSRGPEFESRHSDHEKTVDESRRFFQRSLPLRASEAADAVKLLRSEVCLASVLWANFTSLCAAAQNFTMAQP